MGITRLGSDASPGPMALTARRRTWYHRPLTSPVIVTGLLAELGDRATHGPLSRENSMFVIGRPPSQRIGLKDIVASPSPAAGKIVGLSGIVTDETKSRSDGIPAPLPLSPRSLMAYPNPFDIPEQLTWSGSLTDFGFVHVAPSLIEHS